MAKKGKTMINGQKISSIDKWTMCGVVIYFLISISIILYKVMCYKAIIPNGPEVQTIISKLDRVSDVSTFIFLIAFALPELISLVVLVMKGRGNE